MRDALGHGHPAAVRPAAYVGAFVNDKVTVVVQQPIGAEAKTNRQPPPPCGLALAVENTPATNALRRLLIAGFAVTADAKPALTSAALGTPLTPMS